MASPQLDPLLALSSDYLGLLTTGQEFSDVIFCVEGRQVHAHRCILAARSSFFRLMFCDQDSVTSSQLEACGVTRVGSAADRIAAIPVEVVGYDVFMTLLRFLYSGQLIIETLQAGSSCQQRGCTHSHCSFGIDLSLALIQAAKFFIVDQLSDLVQRRLASVLDNISVDNLMRVLLVSKNQKLQYLWPLCSELVINSGLGSEVLRRYLPRDVLTELAERRLQRGYGNIASPSARDGNNANEEQRILRLQQALDCMDVELVRLMVMGEGLNLDQAHALHYSVANCSREVVKALLELGVVDVNYSYARGRTALHLAAEMASAEMIAVLLDHHADPNAQTEEGFTAMDIVRCLAAVEATEGEGSINQADPKRIHLCIELLQSAIAVARREEAESSSVALTTDRTTTHAHRHQIVGFGTIQDDQGNLNSAGIGVARGYSSGQQISYGAATGPFTSGTSTLTNTVVTATEFSRGYLFPVYQDFQLPIPPTHDSSTDTPKTSTRSS